MVEVGIYVNNRAAVFMGADFSLDRLVDNAVLAEKLGFDFVSVGDSLLAKPRYAPIPVLSAIAARTSRIGLATGILQPHMRNPVVLAQEWATLDVLSGGRTWLGVGLGTGDPAMVAREYEMIGIPKSKRGVAFDEAIRLLKQLWTQEVVTFAGEIFDYDSISLGYGPVQRPHPPIVVACGGYVPVRAGTGPNDFHSTATAGTFHGPFDRVARLGDGWFTGIATDDEYRRTLAHIRELARERYGRELGDDFRAVLNAWINVGASAEQARAEGKAVLEAYHQRPVDDDTLERWLLYGKPDEIAARLRSYVAAGVNTFQLVIASRDQAGQIEAIARDVRPSLG
jgi:alkanesulfonate monooxygenase SsuD/methylene tetrahydromethanopterin reductase-like flavin-dependent oxidoreductase (luciferase family)